MGDREFTHPEWDGVDKLHTFKTLCLDRDTGKILWEQTSYEGKVYDYRHKRGNYAAPTPVTDGKYVYSYFGSEGVYCYDVNGKLIWKNLSATSAQWGWVLAPRPCYTRTC